MVKSSLNQRLKFKLSVVLIAATSIGIIFGLYTLYGIAKNISRGRVEVAEKSRDLDLLNKNISLSQEHKNDIEKISSTLPYEYYEIAFFTSQIETLAQNNNLTIQISIDKDKKEEQNGISSIIHSVNLRGNYSQISEFLSQISKLKYHTSVDALKINSSDGQLIADIKLKLFVR